MEFFTAQREKYREKQAEKYAKLLLREKIRLPNIPARVREDPYRTDYIHLTAFRVDARYGRGAYEKDLQFLRTEIILAHNAGNKALEATLRYCEKTAKVNLACLDRAQKR